MGEAKLFLGRGAETEAHLEEDGRPSCRSPAVLLTSSRSNPLSDTSKGGFAVVE
jgi:hypothetical protein